MTEISKENQEIAKKPSNELSDFKAAFYLMNAKPDSSIQLLEESRKVDLGNIRDLHERVQRKLQNHNLIGQIVGINLQFDKGKIIDFRTWDEFLREDFSTINFATEAINMEWDILIKLPKYTNPQRHTVKVKIGNSISPKEMMQVMWTTDNPAELRELFAVGLIRVDFIDQVMASELIDLVLTWHTGLPKLPQKKGLTKFLSKFDNEIIRVINLSIPILILLIFHFYFSTYCSWASNEGNVTLVNLEILAIIFVSVYLFSRVLSSFISNKLKKILSGFKQYPPFEITNGDTLAVSDYTTDNKETTKSFMTKVIAGFISGGLLIGLKYLIDSVK